MTRPLHPPQYVQILKAPGRAKHNGYKVHHFPPYHHHPIDVMLAGIWQVLPELTPDVRELGLTTPESPPTAANQVDVDYSDYCGVYGDFRWWKTKTQEYFTCEVNTKILRKLKREKKENV